MSIINDDDEVADYGLQAEENVGGSDSLENSGSYNEGAVHPNLRLLSHSSRVLLHSCPRKYELYKLLGGDKEDTADTAFGSSVGVGVQEYMHSKDINRAYYLAFLDWRLFLDDDSGDKKKKNFWFVLQAIDKFVLQMQGVLNDYELVYIGGKPATELGFQIDLGFGFTDRGFLDALFIHRRNREFLVYEGKTTGAWDLSESMYKNSAQQIGYSVIVDAVAAVLDIGVGSSYKVLTNVYKTGDYTWEAMFFTKSYVQRALWIKNTLLDVKHILEYAEEDYFPMHGESCKSYGRDCEYFGICEMKLSSLLGGKPPKMKVDDESKYQFRFTLDELIEIQMSKYGA